MPLSEFSLIDRYFADHSRHRSDVALGIGDDCALLIPPLGQQLAVTLDTLIADVHFFANADPEGIGHKTLAVNLSDLAALGAARYSSPDNARPSGADLRRVHLPRGLPPAVQLARWRCS